MPLRLVATVERACASSLTARLRLSAAPPAFRQHRTMASMAVDTLPDRVRVTGLRLTANLRGHAWSATEAVQQPVVLDIALHADLSRAGASDNIADSISYVDLLRRAREVVESRSEAWADLHDMAEDVAGSVLAQATATDAAVDLVLRQPNAVMHADAAELHICRRRGSRRRDDPLDRLRILGLRLNTVLGLLDAERHRTQPLVVDIAAELKPTHRVSSTELGDAISEHIVSTQPLTVERLGATTASHALDMFPALASVDVRLSKPVAMTLSDSVGVSVHRPQVADRASVAARHPHIAVLALGSNLGDRSSNIELALRLLEADERVQILGTSFLYESEPMYVREQDRFLNGACRISTSFGPAHLLVYVKQIETSLGRRKTIANGPREIDLDILYFDDAIVDMPELVIPHPRIAEREFVLRPLVDLVPDLPHPTLGRTPRQLLATHMAHEGPSQLRQVVPLSLAASSASLSALDATSPTLDLGPTAARTLIMGVLNTTPDSFSDGGDHVQLDVALRAACAQLDEGADIIDVGGCSTRPGAMDPGAEEETRRVAPLIAALRQARPSCLISVDTYRASVARAAVEAGADIVNDVTAGQLDPAMLSTVAELGVPYIAMHMRGDPRSMTGLTTYDDDDVVAGVARELRQRIDEAERAGVRRWNIIIDPGVGFAKDADGNIDLLAGLDRLLGPEFGLEGYPCLVGASRKRFLGHITGRENAKDRVAATVAAHAAAIAAGACIIRAHDIAAARDAALVGDALRTATRRHHTRQC